MPASPGTLFRSLPMTLVACLLATTADAQTSTIKINVVEGQGAINNVQQHRAKEPVIQVVDDKGAPVAGASVTFQLPDGGPSGTFPDDNRVVTVQTDDKGQAVGRGLRPNQTSGRFQIRVTASYKGQTASAVIAQINAEPAGATSGGGGKKALIILLIAGGAGGGLAAALGGKKGSSASTISTGVSTPATVLVPGSPTIQPPH